jgi:methanogenic corrinoid protein MtbC1
MTSYLGRIESSIVAGDYSEAVASTQRELANGTSWQVILTQAMMPAMDQVGADFSRGVAFLPELIAAGHAMSCAVEAIKAGTALGDAESTLGTVVLGTVKGDIHDIGKNLVKISMEGAGLRVIDVGVDVDAEAFAQAARDSHADIVGLSALLSASLAEMEVTIRTVHEEAGAKVLVGGAPLSASYAREVGADGYAPDAYLAAKAALDLVHVAPAGAARTWPEQGRE